MLEKDITLNKNDGTFYMPSLGPWKEKLAYLVTDPAVLLQQIHLETSDSLIGRLRPRD